MRNTIIIVILLNSLLYSFNVNAQTGWQWGRESKNSAVEAYPVAVDINGNVFTGGTNESSFMLVGFDTTSIPRLDSGRQAFVAKYDSAGNFLWAKAPLFGGTALINIATDFQGCLYLYGTFDSSMMGIDSFILYNNFAPGSAFFLIKLNPTGNVVWVNGGSVITGWTIATNDRCIGAITTDATGNILVTGSYSTTVTVIGTDTLINHSTLGTNDIFLAKYNSAGDLIYAKDYGGDNDDFPFAINVSSTNNIYLAGMFGSDSIIFGSSTVVNTASNYSGFVANLDSLGNPFWAECACGNGKTRIDGVAPDSSGNIYVNGTYYGSNITINGVNITNPYYCITNTSAGFVLKLTPSGIVNWFNTLGAPLSGYAPPDGVWCYSIALSKDQNIWISGGFKDSVIIGSIVFHPPVSFLYSADPAFLAEFCGSSGILLDTVATVSGGDDQNAIACDNSNNVYFGADNLAILPYALVLGPDTLIDSSTLELSFVAKYQFAEIGCDTILLNTQKYSLPVSITVYPVPTTNELIIHSDALLPEDSREELYDITGRLMQTQLLTGSNTVINVENLSAGTYMCRIIARENVVVRKVVVE